MIWALIALCMSFIVGALWYFAALLATRLNPENTTWPSLWSAGLLVSLFSPVAGVFLFTFAPREMGEITNTLSLHGVLPDVMPRPGSGAGIDAQPANFEAAWLIGFALALYGCGAVAMLIRLSVGRARVRHMALDSVPAQLANGRGCFESMKAEIPFVWTPFGRPARSRIVLPADYLETFSPQEIDYVIQHERAHIARRDDETGLALRIALSLLWFSPFAHLSFGRWAQACEIQCDAALLKGSLQQDRIAYANVLLRALQITANRVRQYPAATFSNDRLRNEKMRITNIMSGKGPLSKHRTERAVLAAAAVSVSLIGSLGFANLAHADPASKSAKTASTITLDDIVSGRLTAPFGKSFDPFRDGTTQVHNGIDVAAPIGTPITAPANGVIVEATDLYDGKARYGKVVVLATAGDTRTLFSHLDSYSVSVGQSVKKGEQIAEIGNTGKSTGPHVHIETIVAGERVDPLSIWSITK